MNPTKEILDDLETFKQQQIKLIYSAPQKKIYKREGESKIVNF